MMVGFKGWNTKKRYREKIKFERDGFGRLIFVSDNGDRFLLDLAAWISRDYRIEKITKKELQQLEDF